MNAIPPALVIRLPAWRSRVLLIILLSAFAVLLGRAFYLQGLNKTFLQKKGESRYSRVVELSATRGMIMDRNREPLAISTPVESVWVTPSEVEITPEQTQHLARLLDLDSRELSRRITEADGEFAYLKRHLPPEQAARVISLDIPGVSLKREYRRYYPGSEYTAHLIGITNIDHKGQEALELAFDRQLAGKPGSRRVIKDRLGRIVEDVESIRCR
jgi:cell division protein FtsI (penicillin-binding protein 3)